MCGSVVGNNDPKKRTWYRHDLRQSLEGRDVGRKRESIRSWVHASVQFCRVVSGWGWQKMKLMDVLDEDSGFQDIVVTG